MHLNADCIVEKLYMKTLLSLLILLRFIWAAVLQYRHV